MAGDGIRTPNYPLGTTIGEFLGHEIVGNTRSFRRYTYAQVLGPLEALASGVQVGGGLVFTSKAQADANLVYGAFQLALVTNDANTALNGIYQKSGASGTGSWGRVADLPNEVIAMTVTGGTGDAITVGMSPQVPTNPGAKVYTLTPTAANTGTTTINGIVLKSAANTNLAANALLADIQVWIGWAGDHYQLMVSTPVDATGILNDAQAAAAAAAGAATAAASSASALANQVHQYDTRAQAVAATIPTGVTNIIVKREAAGYPLSNAPYVPGTSAGPRAFQEAGSHWWELDLTGGQIFGAWCGIKGDGTFDDTTAFALMRTIGNATGAAMVLPKGDIMLTAGILIDWNYGGAEGVNPFETRIHFNPGASNRTVFKYFKSGDSNGAQFCYLKNLSIYGVGALPKTALSTNNTSNFHLENVFIHDWTGGGADVGWDLRGRELTRANRITIAADIILDIQQNPDRALVGNIDCDFLHITNHWFLGQTLTLPLIRRGNAVNVSSLLIESGSWNLGVNGFESTDTTSTQSSFGFIFRNIRYEQGAANAVMFKFNRTSASRDCKIRIRDCETGSRLLYERGVRDVTLSGCECDVVGQYAIDGDGANCHLITIDDCFWNTGSLVSLPNFAIRNATGTLNPGPSAPALPTSGQFISTTINPAGVGTFDGLKSSDGFQPYTWTGTYLLANLASVTLPPFVSFPADHGRIEVECTQGEGGTALFYSTGLNKLSGSANFSTTTTTLTLSVIFGNSRLISLTNALGSTQRVTVNVRAAVPLVF
jgi:hypothetical protein